MTVPPIVFLDVFEWPLACGTRFRFLRWCNSDCRGNWLGFFSGSIRLAAVTIIPIILLNELELLSTSRTWTLNFLDGRLHLWRWRDFFLNWRGNFFLFLWNLLLRSFFLCFLLLRLFGGLLLRFFFLRSFFLFLYFFGNLFLWFFFFLRSFFLCFLLLRLFGNLFLRFLFPFNDFLFDYFFLRSFFLRDFLFWSDLFLRLSFGFLFDWFLAGPSSPSECLPQ
jgi:hypothetical protein